MLPNIKPCYTAIVIRILWYWQKYIYRSMRWMQNAEIDLYKYAVSFWQESRLSSFEKELMPEQLDICIAMG